MSMGLLFHYFESKEKLYEELIQIGRTHPKTVLDGIGGEPLEFFTTGARDIVQIGVYHFSLHLNLQGF